MIIPVTSINSFDRSIEISPLTRRYVPWVRLAAQATTLDFGCVVGRLTLALAPSVGRVIGVDISEPHLEHARRQSGAPRPWRSRVLEHWSQSGWRRRAAQGRSYHFVPRPEAQSTAGNGAPFRRAPRTPESRRPCHFPDPGIFRWLYVFGCPLGCAAPRNTDMEMHVLPQRMAHAIIREAGCEVVEIREDTMV